jgi:hypothetical protein
VVLDLYPRVDALSTQGQGHSIADGGPPQGQAEQTCFRLFDWDRIYLALQDYKLQRSWSNLRLDRRS